MNARLAAWWAAWKWVAILALACLLLASLNVWQWKRAITAPLRAENAELTETLRRVEKIAGQRNTDDAELLGELRAIAARGQQVRTVYREAAAAAPLPADCAPGQGRIDAVNRALGAHTGE